jgi:TPR repeat protein
MAQSNLATLYLAGRGVKRDPEKALEWSLKAAEKGNIVSQARLGAMYLAGDGVQQDSLKAEYWLAKAADQGYAGAPGAAGLDVLPRPGGCARRLAQGPLLAESAPPNRASRTRARSSPTR